MGACHYLCRFDDNYWPAPPVLATGGQMVYSVHVGHVGHVGLSLGSAKSELCREERPSLCDSLGQTMLYCSYHCVCYKKLVPYPPVSVQAYGFVLTPQLCQLWAGGAVKALHSLSAISRWRYSNPPPYVNYRQTLLSCQLREDYAILITRHV